MPHTPGIDCDETRALLALLVDDESRAWLELRHLGPRARAALATAARRLMEMCEEPPPRSFGRFLDDLHDDPRRRGH